MKQDQGIIFDEALAREILRSNDIERKQEFARLFLFSRKTRPSDPFVQNKIIHMIQECGDLNRDIQLFAAVALGHKSIELQDVSLMKKCRESAIEFKSSLCLFEATDHIRSDRAHAHSSLLSVQACINFFLEDKNALVSNLTESYEFITQVDVSELGKGYFLTCTNFGRILGLCYVFCRILNLSRENIVDIIGKNFIVGMIKRDKPPNISSAIQDIELKKFKAYRSFMTVSRIYGLSERALHSTAPAADEVLIPEILKIGIRHDKILSDKELTDKMRRIIEA